ncbi:hypothetical protein A9P44_01750 [Paenibacillus polymyxa]|nr:hypothetical protein [Paenibacillus polymyxa]OBA08091.1 hypothetical protein A9P44_01750 [Paenibacillus polymyxa]
MKKAILAVASLAVFMSVGSMASASAPAEKQEHKMHQQQAKSHTKKEHKIHAKSKHEKAHKLHAREAAPAKMIDGKTIHTKSIKAKSIKAKATKLPKTGFGGASEQMN